MFLLQDRIAKMEILYNETVVCASPFREENSAIQQAAYGMNGTDKEQAGRNPGNGLVVDPTNAPTPWSTWSCAIWAVILSKRGSLRS
jgi:hypothetical protein